MEYSVVNATYNNGFRANFDRIDPRLSEFVREAVKAYVKSVK